LLATIRKGSRGFGLCFLRQHRDRDLAVGSASFFLFLLFLSSLHFQFPIVILLGISSAARYSNVVRWLRAE